MGATWTDAPAIAHILVALDNQYVRPYLLAMARPSHRENIIQAGVETAYRCGFATTGLRDFAAEAGVPQGSYTNHFRSKRGVRNCGARPLFQAVFRRSWRRRCATRRVRRWSGWRAYFETITGHLKGVGWRHGCLIGNMSLEAADHSAHALRARLVEVFAAWVKPFSEAVRAWQTRGRNPNRSGTMAKCRIPGGRKRLQARE